LTLTLARGVSLVHLILSTTITLSWLWRPFYGLGLLRRADFIVFWDRLQLASVLEHLLFHTLGTTPSLVTFARLTEALYALSFIIVGTLQWLGIGLVLESIWRRTRRPPTSPTKTT